MTARGAFAGFLGGTAYAKFDDLFSRLIDDQPNLDTNAFEPILLIVISFVLGMLFTFVGRYSDGDLGQPQEQPKK